MKYLIVRKLNLSGFAKLTEGTVQRLLKNSEVHPGGIKVMLVGGIVGRVQEIK